MQKRTRLRQGWRIKLSKGGLLGLAKERKLNASFMNHFGSWGYQLLDV